MTEVLLSQGEKLRAQFQELGHVGVKGCFDPALASTAAKQLDSLIRRQRVRAENEYVSNMSGYYFGGKPELVSLVGDITNLVENLDKDLWPTKPNYFLHIEQKSGAKGPYHRDEEKQLGAVAITTLVGSSLLIVEDHSYEMTPGDVVLLKASERLNHQGINTGEDTRIGFAVGLM